MRLICHDSGKLPGEQGFKYITALKPDPNVIDYYSGFLRALVTKTNKLLVVFHRAFTML
jgi:hypothetical protein